LDEASFLTHNTIHHASSSVAICSEYGESLTFLRERIVVSSFTNQCILLLLQIHPFGHVKGKPSTRIRSSFPPEERFRDGDLTTGHVCQGVMYVGIHFTFQDC
jgi:hypothetical protein